jgi:hypothetical protein
MVHNGIEYGVMAAYAEGLNILRHANVGKEQRAVDAETAPLPHPELYQYDLELGVLYLAARRYADARTALDRVPRSHPGYAMALFKRAQVAVLLDEPDKAERIAAARRGADATTRELVARERLFQR